MIFHRLLTAAHALKTLRRDADNLLDRLHIQACEDDTSDCYDNDPYDVPQPVGGPRRKPDPMDKKDPSTTDTGSLEAAANLKARMLNAFAGPLTAPPLAIPA